jgi:hypothetical protein
MPTLQLRSIVFSLLLAGIAFGPLCSCASHHEDDDLPLEEKLEKRNSSYASYNEKRRARLQARQERTDMWFKRVMGVD